MNKGTIIVALIVLLIVVSIIIYMIKNRKAQNPLHRASADPVDNRQHHRPLRRWS